MSKTTKTKQTKPVLAAKKTPFWVWFLALVPVLSSVLFLLILSGAIPFIKAETFHISGILVLFFAIAAWGACGFLFAYFRADMKKSIIIANIFPILCAIVYTISLFFTGFEAENLSDPALFASIGMGLFSYVDTFIYEFFSIGVFGVYIDLIFIIFTFFIGYTLGKAKRLKA